jgi:hypothetical protein
VGREEPHRPRLGCRAASAARRRIYTEAEWRFRITDNGLLGGVVFANMSTFTRPPVSIPGYSEAGESALRASAGRGGVGLRIMQNRQSRTNITLDLTVADKTRGVLLRGGRGVLTSPGASAGGAGTPFLDAIRA